MPYPEGSFDLVYGLSVLTHLDDPQEWVAEIRCVLKPGRFFYFSTIGAAELYLGRMTEEERERFQAGDLVVRNAEYQGSNRCASFMPPEWVRKHLLSGFELLEHIPQGARCNGFQDSWLTRRV